MHAPPCSNPSCILPVTLRQCRTHLEHCRLQRDVPAQDSPEGLVAEVPLVLRRAGAQFPEVAIFPVDPLAISLLMTAGSGRRLLMNGTQLGSERQSRADAKPKRTRK